MEKINDRLMEVIKELNLNQREFADKIGMKSNTFSLIKMGKKRLTDKNIKLICTMFNVNEKWLKEGIEPKFLDEIKFTLIKKVMEEQEYIKLDLINKLLKKDRENLSKLLELIENNNDNFDMIFEINRLNKKDKEKVKTQIKILL